MNWLRRAVLILIGKDANATERYEIKEERRRKNECSCATYPKVPPGFHCPDCRELI